MYRYLYPYELFAHGKEYKEVLQKTFHHQHRKKALKATDCISGVKTWPMLSKYRIATQSMLMAVHILVAYYNLHIASKMVHIYC